MSGGIRIAKADKDDLQKTYDLLSALEDIFGQKWSMRPDESNWEEWDQEDIQYQACLKIRKILADEEGCHEEEVDNRLVMFEFISRMYKAADGNWNRVFWAADCLIDNVCDPTENHLAFHPGFEFLHVLSEQ